MIYRQRNRILSVFMSKEKKSKPKEIQIDHTKPFSVNLDVDTLNKMISGSCIIGSTIPVAHQEPEKVAVCKEGKTIKIFKIVEEKK
jgi:hypothetical protein